MPRRLEYAVFPCQVGTWGGHNRPAPSRLYIISFKLSILLVTMGGLPTRMHETSRSTLRLTSFLDSAGRWDSNPHRVFRPLSATRGKFADVR